MRIEENAAVLSRAYIVFQGEAGLWWLRFLKPGFRHCYLLFRLPGKNSWLELNPCSNRVAVSLKEYAAGFDYLRYLSVTLRRRVVSCAVETPLFSAPLMPFTCVEFAKRVIGCHDKRILTPFQLYKKINNCRK